MEVEVDASSQKSRTFRYWVSEVCKIRDQHHRCEMRDGDSKHHGTTSSTRPSLREMTNVKLEHRIDIAVGTRSEIIYSSP